jgi:hypothetical protein
MDMRREEQLMVEIIRHLYTNRHLSNLGYDSMTIEMKNLFNTINFKPLNDRNV